jgi:hypothetical protein
MRAIRRLISTAAIFGILVASVIAAQVAHAAPSAPVPGSVTVNGVASGLTISIATATSAAAPGTTGPISDSYTSQSNMGGTVNVNCTQTIAASGTSSTTDNSTLTAAYTAPASTTKQTIYMFCLNRYFVKDMRGTGQGYHVTMQATQWKCTVTVSKGCTVGTSTIPNGSFYMDVPQVACNGTEPCTSHGAAPAVKMTTSLPIDAASAVVVAQAAANTGMGTYLFTPRTDVCGANQQCYSPAGAPLTGATAAGQLGLYPVTSGTTATKNGTYSSTLTETVIAGP